jgi:alpha-tubulin suppressor-like RCC1 family protein
MVSTLAYGTCVGRPRNSALYCWGRQNGVEGGWGLPLFALQPTPALVQVDAIEVAARASGHNCAIVRPTMGLRCWGDNEYGQLGDGTTTSTSAPSGVDVMRGVTKVAVGDGFTCVIKGAPVRSLYCWGRNGNGQLGRGDTVDKLTVPSETSSETTLSAVRLLSCSNDMCCATTRSSASLFCWGAGSTNKLGYGGTADKLRPNEVPGLKDIVDISASNINVCVVLKSFAAYCWGDNQAGQLGAGLDFQLGSPPITQSLLPVQVILPKSIKAARITIAAYSGCLSTTSGVLYCWGQSISEDLMQTDSFSLVPTRLPFRFQTREILSGYAHFCALDRRYRVICFGGDNSDSQLLDSVYSSDLSIPVKPVTMPA